jgi:hypothetical protein
MVEACDSDEQADVIVAAIEPQAMELVRDMNGNHVIQRVLAVMGNQRASFVSDSGQKLAPTQSIRVSSAGPLRRILVFAGMIWSSANAWLSPCTVTVVA